METETSKNNLNSQSFQIEESPSEVNEVTDITKKCISYSLENENSQNEKLTVCPESRNSFTRIYLLRHLPYRDCREYSLYEYIRDILKKELSNDEIKIFLEEKYGNFYTSLIKNFEQEENPIKFLFGVLDDSLCTDPSKLEPCLYDTIFQDQKNTILIHNPIDSSKERIKQSVNYIKTRYPDIISQKGAIIGSQKGSDKQLAVIKAGEELVEIIVNIKSEIKQENSKLRGKNIVILGSRSHSHFLNVKKFDTNGKNQTENEFKEKGYDFIDLDAKSELIDDTSKLVITLGNYQELKSLFSDVDDISITDFQDKVNAYFTENPKLYEKYLSSDNSDLRAFCIANLIKFGEFDIVIKNIKELFDLEKEETIIGFANNLLGLCNDEQQKELFKIIADKKNLLGNIKVGKFEYYANYVKYVEDNIKYLREKTQDENIKSGKTVSISVGFKEEQYNNIENLLTADNILLIEATAGSGKSIKLLEIMEYLSPKEDMSKNNFFPIYVHLGKSKKIKEITNEIERQKTGIYGTGKYQYVYLFDAVDEAGMSDDDKEDFLEITKRLQENGKVIITSRHSHLKNESIEKIELKTLTKNQINTYIQSYISGNIEQEELWEKWQEKGFINEIKDNPLMLSMLIEVIRNTNKVKKLKKNGFIENLDIDKKSDLFDIILTLRLYEGEIKKTEDGEKLSEIELEIELENIKKIIEKRKKILELLAVKSVNNNDNLTKKEIGKLILENGLSIGMIGRKNLMENLNIIFKYNSETEQYQFVHEKFREYFLYLNYKGNTEGKSMRKKEDWGQYLGKDDKGKLLHNNDKLIPLAFNSKEEFNEIIDIYINVFKDDKVGLTDVCFAIGKIKSENSLLLLKRIINFKGIKLNGKTISNICWAVGEIKSENGLPLFKKIINFPGFIDNIDAQSYICGAIGQIKSEKGLPLLEKIITLPGFSENKGVISNICFAIGGIKSKKGLSILEKIIGFPGFGSNYKIVINTCLAIGQIKSEEGLLLLEKIMILPIFNNNNNIILSTCLAIGQIKSEEGLLLLEKIIGFPGFLDNNEIIYNLYLAIGQIGSEKGLPLLERIMGLNGAINNKDAISNSCLAMKKIKTDKRIILIEEIIELPGFLDNNEIIYNTCGVIGQIKSEQGLSLLEKVMELLLFSENKNAISNVCWAIGSIKLEKGLSLLKKVTELSGFFENKDAVSNTCGTIREIGSEKGLPLLEKIITLPGFINNPNAVSNSCGAIGQIKSEKGLPLLEKIITLPGFFNNYKAISNACGAIGQIKSEEGLFLLEKVMELPGFLENKNALFNVCKSLGGIKSEKGLPLLEKIIDFPLFFNYMSLTIGRIKSEKGLPLLEKIIDSSGIKNDKNTINNSCLVIGKIKSKKGLPLLEKIIKIEGVNDNGYTIRNICWAIGEIKSESPSIILSEKLLEFIEKYKPN